MLCCWIDTKYKANSKINMMMFGTNGLTALTSEAGGIKIKKI
jgi:hypothetical protein